MIFEMADELEVLRAKVSGRVLHEHTRSDGDRVMCDSPYCPPSTTMPGTVYDGDGKEFQRA
jgi:hypothetical protein